MVMAETSTFGILHGQNVRGRNVLAEMSVAERSVAEISYIQMHIYKKNQFLGTITCLIKQANSENRQQFVKSITTGVIPKFLPVLSTKI